MDSIPEKTLEHWASIYLTYRFRSHCGLWWPTFGEDIALRHAPHRPGKVVLLEMKTSEFDPKHPTRHSVQIRTSQLAKYLKLPRWQQPYYVFPIAQWNGDAVTAALSAGQDPTEGGFSRNATVKPVKWAADWLIVLPAREVGKWVDMSAKEPTIFSVTTSATNSPVIKWTRARQNKVSQPAAVQGWRDFWTWLCACGDSDASQVIALPPGSATHSQMSRKQLLRQIAAAQQNDQETSEDNGNDSALPEDSSEAPTDSSSDRNSREVSQMSYWAWTGQSYRPIDPSLGAEHDEISRSLVGVHLDLGLLTV